METDPTRALEWMIGLPVITFLGGEDGAAGEARIHVETRASRLGCPDCGVVARVKDRSRVELVDLPLFGRPTRLVWHKRRWTCPDGDCPVGSWTEEDDRIAAPRQVLTSRAARWATAQVGRHARSVNEVAMRAGLRLAHRQRHRRRLRGSAPRGRRRTGSARSPPWGSTRC